MTPEMFRQLAALGLSHDQMAGVLEIFEAEAEARKAKARARVQKWRDNHKDVTSCNVTKRNKPSRNATVGLARVVENISSNSEVPVQEEESPLTPPRGDVDDCFARFWNIYPKRGGANPRKPAFDKFRALSKRGADPEAIIAGAEAYAHQCQALGKLGTEHVAQAMTWLNQERWADDHTVPLGQGPPRHGNGRQRSGMIDVIEGIINDDDGQRESEDQGDWGTVHSRRLPAPGAGGD